MAKSRPNNTVPYAVAGAIVLFGALSCVSVLVSPGDAKRSPRVIVPAHPRSVIATAAVTPASVPVISRVASATQAVSVGASAASQAASVPAAPASGPGAAGAPVPLVAASVITAVAPPSVPSVSAVAPPPATSTQPSPGVAQRESPALVAKAPVKVATPVVVAPPPVLAPAPVTLRPAAQPRAAERPVLHAQRPPVVTALPAPTVAAQSTGPLLPPAMAGGGIAPASEGPAVFKADSTSTVKTTKPAIAATPANSAPALVTASGNKAWIRLDDRRTVTVEKGQSLEGYGVFIGVEHGTAKFERGNITSHAETTDASSRN